MHCGRGGDGGGVREWVQWRNDGGTQQGIRRSTEGGKWEGWHSGGQFNAL